MGAIGGDELSRWEQIEGGGGSSIRTAKEERIVVSVRMRPMNEMELARHDTREWECIDDTTIVYKSAAADRSMYPSAYTFDRVFGCNSDTKQVYEHGAKEVALAVVSGINSSVFAYGQTSSGKTYTMAGITEYGVADIYDYIQKHKEREFVLKFSAMEIYNESVRDLLSTDTTPLRLLDDPERGTVVERLIEETLRDKDHLKELLALCDAQRQIGETCLNEASSRSHQILRLTIESSPRELISKESLSTLAACVNFVDLAGSERASQAMSAGNRLKEGCHINRSLLTLGTVIRKLSKGRNGHVPYRDSKLTRILQMSLGGNARTAIICTMSPARSHVEQSRNTLLFATCAKEVATNAKVNVLMSDKALVRHLQRELARLENELRSPRLSCISESEALRERDAQIKKMEKEMRELIRQRDLAQSRLEDLLRAVGDDSREEISQHSASHIPNEYENEDQLSEASGVSYRNADFGFKKLKPSHWRNDSTGSSLQLFEKLNDAISPRNSISSIDFSGLVTQPEPLDTAQNAVVETDDYCKEVQCIELEESTAMHLEIIDRGEQEQEHQRDKESMAAPEEHFKNMEKIIVDNIDGKYYDESNEKIQDAVKTADSIEPNHDTSSLLHPVEDLSDTEGTVLSRSKSCSATLSSVPSSPSTPEAEKYRKAQVAGNMQDDFCGSCELQEMPEESLVVAVVENLSTNGSGVSEQTTSKDAYEIRKTFGASKEDIAVCDSIQESNEIIKFQKHNSSEQDNGKSTTENCASDTIKDVRVDSMLNSAEAPSEWSLEFAKKQKEIIYLWDACNVSLVHRTYFFLLFSGNPADAVYMEVEQRRLLFLKRCLSAENLNNVRPAERKSALATSRRILRDDKKMLYELLQKRLSRQEREEIYTKWGIDLNSKRRKLQLLDRLWSKPEDIEHIRESATLVARLTGIVLEQGAAHKEMFELSFTTNKINQVKGRSYSLRHRKASFK